MSIIPGEEVGACFVSVGVDTSGLKSGMAAAKSEAMSGADSISAGLRSSLAQGDYKGVGQKLGADLVQGMGSQFGLLGNMAGGLATAIGPVGVAALAAGAGIAVLGKGIASAVSTAADFQQSMANVASVAGGGAEALQQLSDAAREAGAGTVFSASQAAEAEYFLASAGMSTNEIIASLNDTLLLAGAGGLELGRSAEIVTGTLAQFQMGVEETGRVTNVMAAAAAGSNTTISQLGEGMKNAGSFANAAGVSFEATSAALMVFADSNIKGAEGGTALKSIIANLLTITPAGEEALAEMGLTATDVSLETHTLDEVLTLLNEHQMTAAQSSALFGKEMAGAGTVLVGGADKLVEYTDAITGTSKAQEMYATQNATFQSSMKMLGSAIEEAKISLGGVFLPVLTDVASGLAGGVVAITGFGQSLYGIGQGVNSALEPLGGLVGVIEKITLLGPALDVAGSATGFVGDLASDLSSIATGDINIGGEYFGSTEDLKAARDAGKLTGDEYINGIREVVRAKSDVSGIDTSRMMSNIQGFAESGLLDEEQYTSALKNIAEIYEEVGDAAYEMANPITEAFEDGTISAEDYITVLEDMADVTSDLGEGAEDVLEPLTKAFEDGSITVDEYKSALDTLSQATSALGADFDSIAGPIQDAFEDGKLSVEQYQDALSTVTQAHEQLGAATQSVLSPLSEMFASGEISADEYISSLDAVLAGVDSWGPEFNRRMADLNANAGNMSAEEYMDAFNGIISDLNIDIEKSLEDVDAEGVGGKAGKSFGDEFLKGFKDAKISEELAGFIASGFSDAAAVAAYNSQNSYKFSRSGTVDLGDLGEGGFTKKSSGTWEFYVNGQPIVSGDSTTDLLATLARDAPAIRTLIDPREMEAAIAGAKGDYILEYRIRAEIIADLELQEILNAQEAEWLAAEEAFQEMMDGLSEAYHDAFDDAMGEGVIIDWATAWGDAGEMAADAFSDNLISGVEARDIIGALEDLKILDPKSFEEMGGEDALAWWQGLSDLLEERADMLAIDINANTSEIDNEITDAVNAGEPYLASVKAVVSDLATPEISAFREARLWADWGGSDAKRGLGEYSDDLMSLYHEIENATEYQSDLNDAFEMMIDPLRYTNEELAEARNILLQYTDATEDQIDATMRYYASIGDAATVTKELKNEVTEAGGLPDWFSGFALWQEANTDMFDKSYIGETEGWAGPGMGAKEGYEAENYFQYDVEVGLTVDPSDANAELDVLESDIAVEKIAPIDADISPAMSELGRLEAEIMEPVTKPVYLEVISSSQGIIQSGVVAEGVEPVGSWLSFANEGVVSSPVRAIIGDAPVPEAVMRVDTLFGLVQQAVASADGNGGGNTFQLIVQGNITEDVWPQVRSEFQQMIEENNTKLSNAYNGRSRGGL